jgi:Nucleotidyltransferase domain
LRSSAELIQVVLERFQASNASAHRWLDMSSEIIVFGSMAAGLERPNSDLDVLCIASSEYKLKTKALDLIVCTPGESVRPDWAHGELAAHIAEYGIWIKGRPNWTNKVHITETCINRKRRRIVSFLRTLPFVWSRLHQDFQTKYSIKLRRETQRLILLERGVPIPPTRMLDCFWMDFSKNTFEIHDKLDQLSGVTESSLLADLHTKIEAHFAQRTRATALEPSCFM